MVNLGYPEAVALRHLERQKAAITRGFQAALFSPSEDLDPAVVQVGDVLLLSVIIRA